VIGSMLAALDGSPRARGVFDAATEMAGRYGALLHVLRVVMVPPEFPAAGAGNPADPLPGHLVKVALEDLVRITSTAAADPHMRLAPPIVRVGEPWRVILELSDELDVDLIAVGSHGYGTLDRILGTTAGRVANIATRNVLVVHERFERFRGTEFAATPYR
jgi:nucleotide-binding universal stress UspA family protein